MRRNSFIAAVLLLTGLVTLLAAVGCGSKSGGTSQSGLGFLDLAKEDLQEAVSFRLEGSMDMTMKMSGMGADVPIDMSIPMVEEVEQEDGSLKMKATVGVSGSMSGGLLGDGSERTIEMYLMDDRLYFENEGRWFYTDYGMALNPMSSNSQLVTPDSILKMLEYADSVIVMEESETSVKYHVVVGDTYFDEALKQAREAMPGFPLEQYEEFIKAMRYEMELTVDKESGHITRLSIVMRGDDLEFMEGVLVSMDVNGTFDFSDYGQDFDIELPEEAAEAEYVDINDLNTF